MPRKSTPAIPAEHRYERFAAEYLIDLNATGAYRRAINPNASDRTAGVEGSKYLRIPDVVTLVTEGRKRLMGVVGVTQERVVEEYRRIAFLDPREVMSWNADGVRFHPSDTLTPEAAAAIASVKSKRSVRTDDDGNETVTVEQEIKLVSKIAALDSLSKHLGLFKPQELKITGGGGVLVIPAMDAAAWAAEAARQQATHGEPKGEG